MVKGEEEDFSVASQLAEFVRLAPGPATFSRFKFDQENTRSKPDLVGDNDLASMRNRLLDGRRSLREYLHLAFVIPAFRRVCEVKWSRRLVGSFFAAQVGVAISALSVAPSSVNRVDVRRETVESDSEANVRYKA
jgi:hypothetical protein